MTAAVVESQGFVGKSCCAKDSCITDELSERSRRQRTMKSMYNPEALNPTQRMQRTMESSYTAPSCSAMASPATRSSGRGSACTFQRHQLTPNFGPKYLCHF